jgi:hypothetical protein
MEMAGHVENGHMLRKLQDVPLETAGIGKSGIGKTEVYLQTS